MSALLLALLAAAEEPASSSSSAAEAPPAQAEVSAAPGGEASSVGEATETTADPVDPPTATVKQRARVFASDYPRMAKGLAPSTHRCVVRLVIDEQGVPEEATPIDCPELYQPYARRIAMRYRFYPVVIDGVPTRFVFDLTVNFFPPK